MFYLPGIFTGILFYLLIVNVIAFVSFAWDKLAAMQSWSRIPESFLLLISAIGGAFGALVGMVICHHKISKPKFRYSIPFISIFYLVYVLISLINFKHIF